MLLHTLNEDHQSPGEVLKLYSKTVQRARMYMLNPQCRKNSVYKLLHFL